jgi:hypothetical protein
MMADLGHLWLLFWANVFLRYRERYPSRLLRDELLISAKQRAWKGTNG